MNPLESWCEEQRSAFLYRACAEAESGTPRAALFARLAIEAEAQAAIWRAQLTARGHPAPGPYVPDERAKLSFLKDPKELLLKMGREIPHFVEEDCSTMRQLKSALPILNCAGEGTFYMTKKLSFQQF